MSLDEAFSGLGMCSYPDTPVIAGNIPMHFQVPSSRFDYPTGYGGSHGSRLGPRLESHSQVRPLCGGEPYFTPSMTSYLREGDDRFRDAPGKGVRAESQHFSSGGNDDLIDWDMCCRGDSPGNLMGLDSPKKGSGHDAPGIGH